MFVLNQSLSFLVSLKVSKVVLYKFSKSSNCVEEKEQETGAVRQQKTDQGLRGKNGGRQGKDRGRTREEHDKTEED